MVWPNFFIVGAPKTATTSIYEYLKTVPEIYLSSLKEPSYFAENLFPADSYSRRIGDKEEYLSFFQNVRNEKIIGEASTAYLVDPDAARLIKEISPDSKCLISLRDPVERAFSHYRFHCQYRKIAISFHDQIKNEIEGKIKIKNPRIRLKDGFYCGNIKRFWEIFGKNKIMITLFEDFIQNPKKIMEEILEFLEINYTFDNFQFEQHNKTESKILMPKGNISKLFLIKVLNRLPIKKMTPELFRKFFSSKLMTSVDSVMNDKDRQLLIDYYKDDVKKLENILGRKLPWKNFQK